MLSTMSKRPPALSLTRRILCVGGVLAMLGACATAPVLTPVADGQPLRVVVGAGLQDGETLPIRNLAVGAGASAGAGTGAIAGGLWGLTCGPFAVLCVPLGATAGLLSGGAAGAVVGATGALPADKAARLRERLQRDQPASALAESLQREVATRVRTRWALVDDPAAAALVLDLQALELHSTQDGRVALVLRVQAQVRPAGAPPTPEVPARRYEVVGPLAPLPVWLDEGSDFVATSFANALRQVAAQVVAELGLR